MELFKKNKNDYNDLIKYINYIISYGSIYSINNYLTNSNINNTNSNHIKLNNTKLKLTYHTKYNDMKQDKSYFFNNIQYKFNISNSLDNGLINDILYKTKIVNKNKINHNTKIFNNIIDLDILYLYDNLGYSFKETHLNKTIYTKFKKYILILYKIINNNVYEIKK